jgi:putative oxidoreductase
MKYVPLVGRILYSLIFIMAIMSHFSSQAVGYASAQGVPMASFIVPFTGIMAGIGGLSILLGYKAKWGAWLLVIFLVPVTIMMHNFWAVKDPMMQQMQMAFFIKNFALVGTALLISYFGSGPMSLDVRAKNPSLNS